MIPYQHSILFSRAEVAACQQLLIALEQGARIVCHLVLLYRSLMVLPMHYADPSDNIKDSDRGCHQNCNDHSQQPLADGIPFRSITALWLRDFRQPFHCC